MSHSLDYDFLDLKKLYKLIAIMYTHNVKPLDNILFLLNMTNTFDYVFTSYIYIEKMLPVTEIQFVGIL